MRDRFPKRELQSLPDDVTGLRELPLSAMAERDALKAEWDAAVNERDSLLAQNDRLRRPLLKQTGCSPTRSLDNCPGNSCSRASKRNEQAIAKADAEAEKRDPKRRLHNAAKRRASRGALPAQLPQMATTLLPEDTARPSAEPRPILVNQKNYCH